jgi:hypothetical protein
VSESSELDKLDDPATARTDVTAHGLSHRELDAALQAAPVNVAAPVRATRPAIGGPRYSVTMTGLSVREGAAVMNAVGEHFRRGWSGADLIARERVEQRQKGYTAERDAEQIDGRLVAAALYYLNNWLRQFGSEPVEWPWTLPEGALSPGNGTPADRALVKAGALIAAELDRRATLRAGSEEAGEQ